MNTDRSFDLPPAPRPASSAFLFHGAGVAVTVLAAVGGCFGVAFVVVVYSALFQTPDAGELGTFAPALVALGAGPALAAGGWSVLARRTGFAWRPWTVAALAGVVLTLVLVAQFA
jgi:hypothetical protein